MRVLVGCEESGKSRDAFLKRGHDAWSNDIIPSRAGGPHLQMCVKEAIRSHGPWDIILIYPECTKLCNSGNRTYGFDKPLHHERVAAIDWTLDLWELACNTATIGVCMEQPRSVISKYLDVKPQHIQPWHFGHPETKLTWLFLDRLPQLERNENWRDTYNEMWKLPQCKRERVFYMGPSPTRARDRAETYQGVANAKARQWG